MGNVKWIKINVDMFDDEKIKIVQSMPEGDALLIVWIKLITLAGKTNDGGYVYIHENMPYTEEMLSTIINKPISIIRLALNTFISLGMIESDEKGIYLVNFEKHQSLDKLEKIKEQTRQRVARHREKVKQLNEPKNDVTLHVTHSNDIEEEIEEEIDKDINKEKINKKETSNEVPKKTTNKFVKPTLEEVKTYCNERNNSIDAESFIDYYECNGWKVGKNSMKDWKAAVRTWERRNKDFKPNNNVRQEIVPNWINTEPKTELLNDDELKALEDEFEMFKEPSFEERRAALQERLRSKYGKDNK